MSISSIDEMLMGGSTALAPMSPEEKMIEAPEPIEELEKEIPEYDTDEDSSQPLTDDEESDEPEAMSDKDESDEPDTKEYDEDEYGNKKERMSKGMKERLDRKEKQHQRDVEERDREITELRAQLARQGASTEVQQAARDFEYDPEAKGDWQQQLASFVKQTVNSMTREQEDAKSREIDAQAQTAFETKFRNGMNKFEDFREVISNLNFDITDAMTLATRAMENPAAFLYAAAKRNPQDLERISKIRDPYAQITAMGELEGRMRRNKPTTKAPRPLGRTSEDATSKVVAKEKNNSGDDLLAKADAKRLSTVKTRLKSNR